MKLLLVPNLIVILILIISCRPQHKPGSDEHIRAVTESVDDNRLVQADNEPGNWFSYGRNYAEDRFSALDQITTKNIAQMGLVWSYNLATKRGIEATPLVVDGILFTTGPWSVVYAFDVRKGDLIWVYDPKVPREFAERACCDVVNRGPALYKGKVYVGTLDGRLVAIDASNGSLAWEIITVDQNKPYTITGAPRVVDGKVIIGNGGAEYGVRGYITAYDAETGELVWRTYTVPGDPSKPFESKAMEEAAKTWTGQWWESGGGGTVWDAMAYDPELKLLYIGTGNGSPWDRYTRSPEGGDNLYLSSILAINPNNGELVWHYQTTPGDAWDYTATQHMILANLEIKGQPRKVIMQAPKNGFFYVIDRVTGEFLSAKAYTEVNWAYGIDSLSGRPIEIPGSDYQHEPYETTPNPYGGHNWQPMAYHPENKLVYVPIQSFRTIHGRNQELVDLPIGQGYLLAWDPVTQSEAWRISHKVPWNGGVLATGGGLIFQGTGDGRFVAYDAKNGEKLWEAPTGTGIIGSPITYLVDEIQYVTIIAGWGGGFALFGGEQAAAANYENPGRIFTFALGGKAPFPAFNNQSKKPTESIPNIALDQEIILKGEQLYRINCQACHGRQVIAGGMIPDLRYSSEEIHNAFENIVLEGLLFLNGMPNFGDRLTKEQVKDIQSYVISRSIETAQAMEENN